MAARIPGRLGWGGGPGILFRGAAEIRSLCRPAARPGCLKNLLRDVRSCPVLFSEAPRAWRKASPWFVDRRAPPAAMHRRLLHARSTKAP